MKKEWLLLSGSVVITLLISLGVIRWLAPGLLGIPADLELVQIDKKVPPFYEGVFRTEDYQATDELLKDPLTRVRGRPLLKKLPGMAGPHDVLGFRNHQVPNVADVITIGDSMTYGINVRLEESWPGVVQERLGKQVVEIYNMSIGGWAAVQYLDMFANATVFQPEVIVVAFYTGNDPLESFQAAYGIDSWHWLRPDTSLSKSDSPTVEYPPPESDKWHVSFSDGEEVVFTPRLRLSSNMDHPAVDAGYAIMARVAGEISKQASDLGIQVVFTIIPTKELAYAKKVAREGLQEPDDYTELVARESRHLHRLVEVIKGLPYAGYIDVLNPLQDAVMSAPGLYPSTDNGHPEAAGYRVIGETIANGIEHLLPPAVRGIVAFKQADGFLIMLVKNDGVWYFDSMDLVVENGWLPDKIPLARERDIARLPFAGEISEVHPEQFGPGVLAGK